MIALRIIAGIAGVSLLLILTFSLVAMLGATWNHTLFVSAFIVLFATAFALLRFAGGDL